MIFPNNKFYFLLLLFFTFSICAFADEILPTAEDINQAAQKANQTYDSFFKQTFDLRMQYEYSGRFLKPEDKDIFYKAAEQTSDDLKEIAEKQNSIKTAIEAYQKDDWETLYGQTGLWRKVKADIANTQLKKLEIDYVLEHARGSTQTEELLLKQWEASELSNCDIIKMRIEKIKCFGLSNPKDLNEISDSITKSDCGDNTETLLALAVFQNKYSPDNLKTTLSSSKVRDIFSKLIMDDIFSSGDLNSLNPVTAELAAITAWETKPPEHKELILAIANIEKLKTSGTIGLAGVSLGETDPRKAIELLIESSRMQSEDKKTIINLDASSTAERAATIALASFKTNKIDCNIALAAFENYTKIAAEITEDMQYFYGEILSDCGKPEQARQIFKKLADTSINYYHDKAVLELLKLNIDSDKQKTLPQLRDFILNCTGQDKIKLGLRLEAMDLYCRTAVALDDNEAAIQLLNLLDTAEQTPGIDYELFKAQAFYQSGRFEESARYMSKAITDDSGSPAPVAFHTASSIVEKIELWQRDSNDFNELLRNCLTLAEYCNKSMNTPQSTIVLAEISILNGKIPVNGFTNDESSLRVQARALMQEQKFEQAAKIWAKMAESRRNEFIGRQRSYGWWQAKFYELDCLSKTPHADMKNIAHAADVLIGSFPQIQPPWAEKLDLLKKKLAN